VSCSCRSMFLIAATGSVSFVAMRWASRDLSSIRKASLSLTTFFRMRLRARWVAAVPTLFSIFVLVGIVGGVFFQISAERLWTRTADCGTLLVSRSVKAFFQN
jgi:hypothetical protein